MNHPYPCWVSQDEARHARAQSELEDEFEFWSRAATARLREQLTVRLPGETWFSESVRGPKGFYSPDEVLAEAIAQNHLPLIEAVSKLMYSEAAEEVRELMLAFWDGLHNDANAAWLKLTRAGSKA